MNSYCDLLAYKTQAAPSNLVVTCHCGHRSQFNIPNQKVKAAQISSGKHGDYDLLPKHEARDQMDKLRAQMEFDEHQYAQGLYTSFMSIEDQDDDNLEKAIMSSLE